MTSNVLGGTLNLAQSLYELSKNRFKFGLVCMTTGFSLGSKMAASSLVHVVKIFYALYRRLDSFFCFFFNTVNWITAEYYWRTKSQLYHNGKMSVVLILVEQITEF